MRRVRIIRSEEKELCQIIMGIQITNIIFRGKRYGNWEQIRGIACSLCERGISQMVMGGKFRAGLPKLAVKGLFKYS